MAPPQVKRQDREHWVRAKVVINRPFRAAFEATIKSHERDQRSDTADRVRIVESIGLRIGLCAALSIRNYKQYQVVNWCFGGRGVLSTALILSIFPKWGATKLRFQLRTSLRPGRALPGQSEGEIARAAFFAPKHIDNYCELSAVHFMQVNPAKTRWLIRRASTATRRDLTNVALLISQGAPIRPA